MTDGPLLPLLGGQPLFIGFKLDNSLSRQLEALAGSDRRYVTTDNSDFLRICRLGDDRYVGKLIHERLTTERVDDIRRNVLSILSRLCPETRFPEQMVILACGEGGERAEPASGGREW